MLLGLNYMAQMPIIFIAAGAGFTGQEQFSSFGVSVLIALFESSLVLFMLPGAVLILLGVVPLVPSLGVFLIQEVISNVSWIIYLVGILAFSLNVLIDPSRVSVRMLLTYVPLVAFSL